MKLKNLLIATICATTMIFPFGFITKQAETKTKSYSYGDAINYQGELIIGSTNMSGLEIFTLENNKIVRKIKFNSFRNTYGGFEDFRDLMFNIEEGKLFVYLSDGPYIYKYDVSDPSNPRLVFQNKDNSFYWTRGFFKTEKGMLTVANKGIRLWNKDFQVIDAYNVVNKRSRSVSFASDLSYIFSVDDNALKVFRTENRDYISNITLTTNAFHNRKVFYDQNETRIYFVDDSSIKKTNINGDVYGSFKHTSNKGYDVAPSKDGNYVYFSDGMGVVKILKETMKPVKWINAGTSGAWSMGLNVASDSTGEKVVIFNNTNIMVADSNLNKIDTYYSTEESSAPVEQLGLTVDKIHAAPNSQVMVSGKGFGLNEDIVITFANKYFYAKTDDNGKFTTIITVPEVKTTRADIKADGKQSKLTYSIGFQIE